MDYFVLYLSKSIKHLILILDKRKKTFIYSLIPGEDGSDVLAKKKKSFFPIEDQSYHSIEAEKIDKFT